MLRSVGVKILLFQADGDYMEIAVQQLTKVKSDKAFEMGCNVCT